MTYTPKPGDYIYCPGSPLKRHKIKGKQMTSTEHLKDYQRKVANGEVERPKQKNPIEKAQQHPTSKAMAIAAKCYDCIYDPQAGGGSWRQQVRDCEDKERPLWNVRPK